MQKAPENRITTVAQVCSVVFEYMIIISSARSNQLECHLEEDADVYS